MPQAASSEQQAERRTSVPPDAAPPLLPAAWACWLNPLLLALLRADGGLVRPPEWSPCFACAAGSGAPNWLS